MTDQRQLPEVIGRTAGEPLDRGTIRGLGGVAVSSMRAAGAGAVGGGRWLAETVLDLIPHIPIRDLDTLRAHHRGATDEALAAELIRAAARATAAVGAATGAVAAAEEFAPPAWITLPIELVLETLAVAAIEMKLVAELHEAFGRPVPGRGRDRALVLAQSWADRRGITTATFAAVGGLSGGLSDVLGRRARDEAIRMLRRRLLRRTARHTTSLAPFLIGAVAGSQLNRRATVALGNAIVRDLSGRSRRWPFS